MAWRSAARSMRCSASVVIQRIASVPMPDRSAALWIHVCVSPDAYTRSGRASGPATPAARTSQSAAAARAAKNATVLAMLPPLTNSPPQSAG